MEQPKKRLAKSNVATRQDSLQLRNNAIKVRDYYNKPEYVSYTDSNFFSKRMEKEKNIFKKNDIANKMYLADKTLMRLGLIDNDYRVEIDKNKYKQRELSNGILDKRSPMQLFDKRITPTSHVKKINTKEGEYLADVVEMYQYDPLAVTPFDLLTEKEKEQRVKKYGRDGVPNSYQTSIKSSPKVTQGKQVKEEGSRGMVLNQTLTKRVLPVKTYQKPKPLQTINPLKANEVIKGDNTLNSSTVITQPARVPKSYSVEESSPMEFGAHTTTYEVSDIDNITAGKTGTGSTRKITPKYAIGGKIDPPIKTVKDQAEFNNNWFANRVINGKPINVKSRVTNPDSISISNLNPVGAKSTTYGQYNPNNNQITYDPRFTEKVGIPSHEQYHEFQKSLQKEDKNKYQELITTPINKVLQNTKIDRAYSADPDEISAKIQQLRWGKDFKPNQVVTPQDIERVDLGSYDLQDFDREQVVQLLNSVAYNSNTDTMKNKAKRLTSIKGKPLMATGGRLPYANRHIAPSTLVGGAASMASLIPDPVIGAAVGGGLSLISGLLGKSEQEKEEARIEQERRGQLVAQQASNDAINAEKYDTSGDNSVKYYARGGNLPSTGQFNTKGGELVPISSNSEVAVGNTHGEKTIDNSYGITLQKGNTPIAEVENQEVIKDGKKVYSDRLMYNTTQTFADKAKQLGVKAGKLETKLNSTKDTKDRNGYERMLAGVKMGEEVLYAKQEQEKQIQGLNELESLPVKALGGNLPYGTDRALTELNKYLASSGIAETTTLPSGETISLPQGNYTPKAAPNLSSIKGGENRKAFMKDLLPNLIDNVGNAIITSNTPKTPKPIYNPSANIETNINVNPQLAEISNTANTIQDNILSNTADSNVARANIASSRYKAMEAKLGVLANKEQGERGLRNTQAKITADNVASNNAKLEDYNQTEFARKNEIASRWSSNLANLSSDIKDTQTRQETKETYNKIILADLLDDKTGQKLRTFMNNPSLFNLNTADREALMAEYRRRKANSITKP